MVEYQFIAKVDYEGKESYVELWCQINEGGNFPTKSAGHVLIFDDPREFKEEMSLHKFIPDEARGDFQQKRVVSRGNN